ncbi:MAG: hypothetical protein HOI15_02060 [Opitutales bacterium]|nr:hypothetical protein [Opitutales bacterium]MBT6381332.1 hypothetical protein [Opitutales bacterium]
MRIYAWSPGLGTMQFNIFLKVPVDRGRFGKYGSAAAILQSWIDETPELGERIHPGWLVVGRTGCR